MNEHWGNCYFFFPFLPAISTILSKKCNYMPFDTLQETGISCCSSMCSSMYRGHQGNGEPGDPCWLSKGAPQVDKIMQICWICCNIPYWWIFISVFQHEYVNHLNWLQLESQDVFHGGASLHQVVHPSISHEFREARKMWNTWNLQKTNPWRTPEIKVFFSQDHCSSKVVVWKKNICNFERVRLPSLPVLSHSWNICQSFL